MMSLRLVLASQIGGNATQMGTLMPREGLTTNTVVVASGVDTAWQDTGVVGAGYGLLMLWSQGTSQAARVWFSHAAAGASAAAAPTFFLGSVAGLMVSTIVTAERRFFRCQGLAGSFTLAWQLEPLQ